MSYNSKKVIEVAKGLLKQCGYFVDDLWHVDDVHFICEQSNLPRISDSEAMEVYAIAREQFDGEVGISWPQLDRAVQLYMHQKAVLTSICESSLVE